MMAMRSMLGRLCAVLLTCSNALPALAQQDATSASSPEPLHPETASVPVPGAGLLGSDVQMVTLVYKPAGPGPYPVLLFSHGRAADATRRAHLERPASPGQVRYWLARGVAVVAPIRPGYGATGGPDAEAHSARFDANGQCVSRPSFDSTANAAKRAVQATLAWLQAQPWADTRHVILEGQSVGGLATVATAAGQPPGVIGYINFAGGAGGNPEHAPGHSCDPQQLTALYAQFGKSTVVPNLWIYAENDQYWGPTAPKAWHEAFASGGSPTRFIAAPPVADGDGHGLSRHAASLWSGYIDDFLARIGMSAHPASQSRRSPP
jgi:dienelactone hydrolase